MAPTVLGVPFYPPDFASSLQSPCCGFAGTFYCPFALRKTQCYSMPSRFGEVDLAIENKLTRQIYGGPRHFCERFRGSLPATNHVLANVATHFDRKFNVLLWFPC
jgi:hypothetical protein